MGQEQIGGMELAVGIVRPPDPLLEKAPQADGIAKLLKKDQTAEACYAAPIDGDFDFSQSSWHRPQSYLKSRFVAKPLYRREMGSN